MRRRDVEVGCEGGGDAHRCPDQPGVQNVTVSLFVDSNNDNAADIADLLLLWLMMNTVASSADCEAPFTSAGIDRSKIIRVHLCLSVFIRV